MDKLQHNFTNPSGDNYIATNEQARVAEQAQSDKIDVLTLQIADIQVLLNIINSDSTPFFDFTTKDWNIALPGVTNKARETVTGSEAKTIVNLPEGLTWLGIMIIKAGAGISLSDRYTLNGIDIPFDPVIGNVTIATLLWDGSGLHISSSFDREDDVQIITEPQDKSAVTNTDVTVRMQARNFDSLVCLVDSAIDTTVKGLSYTIKNGQGTKTVQWILSKNGKPKYSYAAEVSFGDARPATVLLPTSLNVQAGVNTTLTPVLDGNPSPKPNQVVYDDITSGNAIRIGSGYNLTQIYTTNKQILVTVNNGQGSPATATVSINVIGLPQEAPIFGTISDGDNTIEISNIGDRDVADGIIEYRIGGLNIQTATGNGNKVNVGSVAIANGGLELRFAATEINGVSPWVVVPNAFTVSIDGFTLLDSPQNTSSSIGMSSYLSGTPAGDRVNPQIGPGGSIQFQMETATNSSNVDGIIISFAENPNIPAIYDTSVASYTGGMFTNGGYLNSIKGTRAEGINPAIAEAIEGRYFKLQRPENSRNVLVQISDDNIAWITVDTLINVASTLTVNLDVIIAYAITGTGKRMKNIFGRNLIERS